MSRVFIRRMCDVIGQTAPAGSGRYLKSTYFSAIAASLVLSCACRAAASSALNASHAAMVGAAISGTPSCQRPTSLAETNAADDAEHGIVFLAVCASLFRQFEFVQQQWVQYGLDFNVGSDTCPIVGNHNPDGKGPEAKFVIPTDPDGSDAPYICERVPQFVEPRGGEYFFVPSMTALRMIGMGIVDPT